MEKEKSLLGYWNYTVILTYLGMLMGFTGITLATDGIFNGAIICLMISGICDMFDGAIAATKKREKNEKKFGIQIDSLSDLICFGVLPSIIVYELTGKTSISFVVSGLYVLCALVRLAYFNVSEEERQEKEEEPRKWYQGLPVTTIALILPFLRLINTPNGIILGIHTIVAVLFLVPIQIKKPKIIGKIVFSIMGIVEMLLVLGMILGDV